MSEQISDWHHLVSGIRLKFRLSRIEGWATPVLGRRPFLIILLCCGLTIIVILAMPIIKATGDSIYFSSLENEYVSINDVLDIEDEIYLVIVYGQDCSDWSVAVESGLFNYSMVGDPDDLMTDGSRQVHSIDVVRDVDYGTYNVTVFLNYTDGMGHFQAQEFNSSISYLNVFDDGITIFKKNPVVTLDIENHIPISQFTLTFDTEGDIEVAQNRIHLEEIEAGHYVFETSLVKINDEGDAREIRYSITGVVHGRTIEYHSKTYSIPFNIVFDDEEPELSTSDNSIILLTLIILIFSLMVIFNYYYYIKN